MRYSKKINTILAFIMFFLFFGTVGAMETQDVAEISAFFRAIAYLTAMTWFIYKAGGFKNYD